MVTAHDYKAVSCSRLPGVAPEDDDDEVVVLSALADKRDPAPKDYPAQTSLEAHTGFSRASQNRDPYRQKSQPSRTT